MPQQALLRSSCLWNLDMDPSVHLEEVHNAQKGCDLSFTSTEEGSESPAWQSIDRLNDGEYSRNA